MCVKEKMVTLKYIVRSKTKVETNLVRVTLVFSASVLSLMQAAQ